MSIETYRPQKCKSQCKPGPPKCECPEIKLICADWRSCGKDPEATFKIDRKFAGKEAIMSALAEVAKCDYKETPSAKFRVWVDEFGKFSVGIPRCSIALCIKLAFDDQHSGCGCGKHGKRNNTLKGIFTAEFDKGKHEKYYCDNEEEWHYE